MHNDYASIHMTHALLSELLINIIEVKIIIKNTDIVTDILMAMYQSLEGLCQTVNWYQTCALAGMEQVYYWI